MVSILVELGYTKSESESDLVGWGKVRYQVCRLKFQGKETVVIRYPHLSRFKIFGRHESQEAINITMKVAVDALKKW
ncbi:MAG: hypothetical protein ACI9ES_003514 [Oceanospirillaceae bacterium]